MNFPKHHEASLETNKIAKLRFNQTGYLDMIHRKVTAKRRLLWNEF